jgi:hypothetical protein
MEFLQTNDFWFILIATFSFLLAAYYFFSGQELDKYGIRVEGTVTNYWTEEDDSDDDMHTQTNHYLKAFFTDEENFVHSIEVRVSSKVFRESRETMSIKLVHPPGKHKRAKPDEHLAVYGNAIGWGVVSFVSIVAYLLYLYLK